jgi:WD40 repeat protein
MTASTLFAYDRKGNFIVIGDGSEVLVHSGADESPLWRHTCEAALVGVGATSDAVITLDAEGRLTWWSGKDGQQGEALSFSATPRAFAVRHDGACAVAVPDSVAVANRAEERRSIPIENAGAVAWSDDGSRLAVGTDDGRVRVFLGAGFEPKGTAEIGEAVRSIGWNERGFWIATGGDRVFRIDADGGSSEQITRSSGMTPDCVACSADGSLFSLRLDPSTVVVLAYPSKDTAATIQYVERRALGVAFGPAPYVGIGIDSGDGNKINLRTESVHRTDTHPGRTHNRWLLSVAIKQDSLPPAYRGGANRSSASAPDAPSSAAAPSGGGSKIQLIAGFALVLIGVVILLTRCQ